MKQYLTTLTRLVCLYSPKLVNKFFACSDLLINFQWANLKPCEEYLLKSASFPKIVLYEQ